MDKLIEQLKAYKLEHELPNENESQYNFGYVKAINDTINLVKNLHKANVIKSVCKCCFKEDAELGTRYCKDCTDGLKKSLQTVL